MKPWTAVHWSSADQIIATIKDRDEPLPPETAVAPSVWHQQLAMAGKHSEAVLFIAHALPRYECVVWAMRSVFDSGVTNSSGELMRSIRRWIEDPQDSNRRRTYALIETVRDTTPEYMLAMAVFFSGGSISAPDMPAVLPKPHLTAKFAFGAISKAASKRNESVLRHAIELGEEIAAGGSAR